METTDSMTSRSSVAAFLERAKLDPPGTLIALDVDGTISEIAARPQQARVGPAVRATLRALAERYRVWFISGRDADVARKLAGVPLAGYVGAHGLEVFDQDGLRPLVDARSGREQLRALETAVLSDVPEAGPHVERKRWAVAFHYRQLAPAAAVRRLRTAIEAHLRPGLELREGKKVYEVLPTFSRDKGSALAWLIETVRPVRVLVAGDDKTDIALFRTLAEHRSSRGLDGLSVAVVQQGETPKELLAAADMAVAGVSDLHRLLRDLL